MSFEFGSYFICGNRRVTLMQRVNAVTDQHKNLFNNRLVENVSTFHSIDCHHSRQMFSPRLHRRHLSVVSFFYRLFRMNSLLLRALNFFLLQSKYPNAFSIFSPSALIFYVCVLKHMKASIVLRKSNRLKKIFSGIFLNECGFHQVMGNKGKKFLWKPSFCTIAYRFPAWWNCWNYVEQNATELRLFFSFLHLFQNLPEFHFIFYFEWNEVKKLSNIKIYSPKRAHIHFHRIENIHQL